MNSMLLGLNGDKMYVPVILGTARKDRESEKAAKFMLEEIISYGMESELIDVRDFLVCATSNTRKSPKAQELSEKIKKAEGLVIVSPEYNHGYPGELKIMLDMLYEQYARKPVGICGVSASGLGGARAVEQLRLVSIEFHMVPIREAVYFSDVQNLFDENNKIKDKSYHNRVKGFLEELAWYANALKTAREKG
jgi:NAD(P)H-dependent FMN reductase